MSGAVAVAPVVSAGPRLEWLRERGMGASILVAALAACFGVVLVEATAYIGMMLKEDPLIGDSGTLATIVAILSVLLVGVAMYVAAIVTANTFSTVIAGRTRTIALLRLIGSTARAQRTEIAGQGLVVGVIGAVLGLIGGVGIAAAGVAVANRLLVELSDFTLVQPAVVLPACGVVLTTWAAAWIGSRRVLTVTPLQALGGSVERSREEAASHVGRHVMAIVMFAIGAVLLAGGIVIGLVNPLGVVVAFVGGLLSFTGLSLGAVLIMPPVLRLVGLCFGRSATARLAAENALRYPERSSRMAIGVVMGVTLVTMFAVALESVKALLAQAAGGELDPRFALTVDAFATVMMVLVGISAVIAGIGLVNLLMIGVVQRTRELGLLRAIGLSNGQVRRMILLESLHITIAATVTGLILGVAYGWIAAQSLLGSIKVPPLFDRTAGFIMPSVPLIPVLAVVVAAAVLTIIAAVAPTRLATRVSPVEALAVN